MKTRIKYWIISFFVHTLLLALFQVPWAFFAKRQTFPIQVTLVEKTELSSKILTIKPDSGHGKNDAIKKIVPDYSYDAQKRNLVNINSSGSTDEEKQLVEKNWNSSFFYANDFVTIAKYSQRSAFYRELYRKIDSHILFEHPLPEYNHFGDVFFKFAVNSDGTLIAQTLRASARDRVLKVVTARALRAALAQPVAKPLRLKSSPGPFWLATRVTYESRRNGCKVKIPPETSWLTFCRWSGDGPNHKNLAGQIYDSVESNYTQRDEMDPNPNRHEIAVMLNLPLNDEANRKRQKARELGFNPFLKLEQDPDWEL